MNKAYAVISRGLFHFERSGSPQFKDSISILSSFSLISIRSIIISCSAKWGTSDSRISAQFRLVILLHFKSIEYGRTWWLVPQRCRFLHIILTISLSKCKSISGPNTLCNRIKVTKALQVTQMIGWITVETARRSWEIIFSSMNSCPTPCCIFLLVWFPNCCRSCSCHLLNILFFETVSHNFSIISQECTWSEATFDF